MRKVDHLDKLRFRYFWYLLTVQNYDKQIVEIEYIVFDASNFTSQ